MHARAMTKVTGARMEEQPETWRCAGESANVRAENEGATQGLLRLELPI
jgi:hypothetical protein